jgi:hypothetical protein
MGIVGVGFALFLSFRQFTITFGCVTVKFCCQLKTNESYFSEICSFYKKNLPTDICTDRSSIMLSVKLSILV